MNNKKNSVYELVAANIIKQLEQGTAPWQIPWQSHGPSFELPYNAISGKRYRGINILSLLSAERSDPRWVTFKQAEAQGWKIKKGEKASLIQYIKTHEYKALKDDHGQIVFNESGKPVQELNMLYRPMIANAWVFNAEQINGIAPIVHVHNPENKWAVIDRAEKLVEASKAVISHTHEDRAYYNITSDKIVMPLRHQFPAADKYYATLLHELGHWTAHETRLDRNILYRYGSMGYAREELRAEIASMLLGHELNIGHDPSQHIAYVESWIKILKNTPYEIQLAALEAEKIFNYVLSFDIKRSQNHNQQQHQSHAGHLNPKLPDKHLGMGEIINYNHSSYKICGLLKKGRLKVEDLNSGNSFIVSKNDRLFESLINAKYKDNIFHLGKNEAEVNALPPDHQAKIISIKR